MQNLWIWGKILSSKMPLRIKKPWFSYSLCHFYGATVMTKGAIAYFWAPPLLSLSVFGLKNKYGFGPNFDDLGDK